MEKNLIQRKERKGDKSEGGSPKADITVMLTEQQASKALKGAKVITVQELARQTGVKISAANAFLKNAAKNGTVKVVGGYSGHTSINQFLHKSKVHLQVLHYVSRI